MLEWVCSQWQDSKSQVWVIIFCETESPFESWLITVGVRRSFPPIDIRLISRSFVASFHICCLLSQRQHKEKAEAPNVFLLRGNRRRSRYIRKEKNNCYRYPNMGEDETRNSSLVEEHWFDSRYPDFWCLSSLFLKSTIRRTTRCFGKWFRYTITQRLAGSRNKWGVIKVSS